ncbi:MAG TPA: L,D-transpeptidase family protein [Pseudolabrys sp.]
MASAALAAAVALAGCNADDISPSGRAQAPLSEKMVADITSKNMEKDSPILARIFKEEAELEIWKKNRDGEYALLKTYPICRWSGDLGPKKKEGDRQAPEGFYTITPGQMNPASNYYLAFNTGFPNAYDRAWGYTGSELMVHGDCSSRGCYAMTDEQIQEIYALARESFFGGQKAFQLEAFPFRMTALNMAKHRDNPNFAFWKMLKEGYDHFEASHQEPKVAVCEKRYVFDPAAPDNVSRPLSFNARGKCPVFQLDKNIADAVLDHRRQEQFQMAQYIAKGVATVPPRQGIDGGMNPVFATQIGTQEGYDSKGHVIQVATAPGSLPRTSNARAPAAVVLVPSNVAQNARQGDDNAQVVLASVPIPQPAPESKTGEVPPEKPRTIASLLGNLFSEKQAEPPASTAESQADEKPVTLRGSKGDGAKPKKAAPVRTVAHSEPHTLASAKPKTAPKSVATNADESAARAAARPAARAADKPPTPANGETHEMRTAYSTPRASGNGLLAGAQPVVPVGSFDARWSAFR